MPVPTDVRRPAVAGMFYPSDADELRGLVRTMLDEVEAESAPAIGAVVPHAGLVYSGRCAAHVWKRLQIPETVVILAPNHTGFMENPGGAGAWSHGQFKTPLGDVPIADAFVARLEEACGLVRHDPSAHLREHAVEVQLPFLRLLAPAARLAPIVLAWDHWAPAHEVATALARVVGEWPGEVLLVASSDMTHYESAAAAAVKDRHALSAVEELDGARLLAVCHREHISMCGRGPAAVVVEAARQLGATRAEVVDYRHSGWVTGDDAEVVAYAGVVIA